MEDVWLHGAVDVADLIRRVEVSSVEVVEAFLRRIREEMEARYGPTTFNWVIARKPVGSAA